MNNRPETLFVETPQVRKKLRQESLAKWIFFGMAAAMIVPLLLILGYLIERAHPR
jgi:ABC-type phosphate transport system permease subunit